MIYIMIDIAIDSETDILYQNAYTKLINGARINQSFNCQIPTGTHVSIGRNSYVIIDSFYDDIKKIPQQKYTSFVQELPVGMSIIPESIGFPMVLTENLKISLPVGSMIKLPIGTKLQQINEPVQLILDVESKGKLIPIPVQKEIINNKKYSTGMNKNENKASHTVSHDCVSGSKLW